MDLTAAVALYLTTKAPALSPTTLRWYEHKLRQFTDWCRESESAFTTDDLAPALFSRFLTFLEETTSVQYGRARSSYTRRGYTQVFRQWLDFLASDELALVRPGMRDRLVRIRPDVKVIVTYSDEQLRALFAAAKRQDSPRLVARDTAILSLLLDSGIRASELCGLRLGDVALDRTEPYLTVNGKGRKQREVGFGMRTKKALALYIHRWRPEVATRDLGYVFLNVRGEQLTPDGLDQMLYRLRDLAGGPEAFPGVRVSAHTFRHTFAVRTLERGTDVYALSRILGHTSVTVTQNYLRDFSQRSARRAVGSLLDTTHW